MLRRKVIREEDAKELSFSTIKRWFDRLNFSTIISPSCTVEEAIRLFDFVDRKFRLCGSIDTAMAEYITSAIMRINSIDKNIPVDKRIPIILTITSDGGSVYDGYKIIDAILNSKTPVYTVNAGYEFSMGFLIGLAGDKRYCFKNSQFLMHDGAFAVANSTGKGIDTVRHFEEMEEKDKEYILSRSKITSKIYDDKVRKEWYMYADEAKSYGFVDYIIGQDCDIEAIS